MYPVSAYISETFTFVLHPPSTQFSHPLFTLFFMEKFFHRPHSMSPRKIFQGSGRDSAAAVLRPTAFPASLSLPRFRDFVIFSSSSSSSFPLPGYISDCVSVFGLDSRPPCHRASALMNKGFRRLLLSRLFCIQVELSIVPLWLPERGSYRPT